MSVDTSIFNNPDTLFGQLKAACKDDWHAIVIMSLSSG